MSEQTEPRLENAAPEQEPAPKAELDPVAEAKKKKTDKIFALSFSSLLILLSVFLMIVDLNTLEFGSDMRILGPGAFPLLIFGLMIALNIWLMVQVITGKGDSAYLKDHINFAKSWKAIRLFILIVGCLILMNFAGYVIAMMAFTFVDMMFLSEKKVKTVNIIITTIVLPLAMYFIFYLLNVRLPSPAWMPF